MSSTGFEQALAGRKVLALTGGVGGAKLALGLQQLLPPENLVFAVNTGDDFQHLGLSISPDIDTLVYSLSGLSDYQRGWGVVDETWSFMDALEKIGGETWFQLGDRDLAMHVQRSSLLSAGKSLTEVTNQLAGTLGITHRILPMSDQSVATQLKVLHESDAKLDKDSAWMDFQKYFVARQCEPIVTDIRYCGAEQASLNPELQSLLQSEELFAVIICPSNPFLSIAPMLALPSMKDLLQQNPAPVVVVSPIIAGQAVKGPTAKLMKELSIPQNAVAVADWYSDLLDWFVLDEQDHKLASEFEGQSVMFAQTLMKTLGDKVSLARYIMQQLLDVSASTDGGLAC